MRRRDLLKGALSAGSSFLLNQASLGGMAGLTQNAKKPKEIEVLIDHYTWYHRVPWDRIAFTSPLRGQYYSSDVLVAEQQNEEKNYYGIPADVVSWWGPDHYSYVLFKEGYLKASNFKTRKFCFLYEIAGRLKQSHFPNGGKTDEQKEPLKREWKKRYFFDFNDPYNQETFLQDIDFLEKRYFQKTNYHRIDGKPAIYIWMDNLKNFGTTSHLVRKKVYLIGSEPIFYPPEEGDNEERFWRSRWYDAITCYGINPSYVAENYGTLTDECIADYAWCVRKWISILKLHAPNTELFLPLQFSYHDNYGDRRNGKNRIFYCQQGQAERFIQQVKYFVDRVPSIKGIHITSYNEHYEGTGCEPHVFIGPQGQVIEYKNRWLYLIKKYFKKS
jgi:hypothetical protein